MFNVCITYINQVMLDQCSFFRIKFFQNSFDIRSLLKNITNFFIGILAPFQNRSSLKVSNLMIQSADGAQLVCFCVEALLVNSHYAEILIFSLI